MISIIIPTYNRAHLISETLNSIIAQTYTNWECIIVDDGSIDNTEELITDLIKKDDRFQYYKRPEDKIKGVNSCRNYGFHLSKGNYINWLDSDDLLKPDALHVLLSSFSEMIDVVVAKVELVNFEKQIKIRESNIRSKNLIEDYYINNVAFYVCGPLWKRDFLLKQNMLFDELISNLDDWDFNLRMLYQKPKINYLDISLIQYRVHEDSLSAEINKFNFKEIESEFFARDKHFKIIKADNIIKLRNLRIFNKDRYKYILREALVKNHNKKYYLFRKLLKNQFLLIDFMGMLKSSFGFLLYSILKKGYKFL